MTITTKICKSLITVGIFAVSMLFVYGNITLIDWSVVYGVPVHGDNHSQDAIPIPYQPNNCAYPICAPVGIDTPVLTTPFNFATVTTIATANVATLLPNASTTTVPTRTPVNTATALATATTVPTETVFPTSTRMPTATIRPTFTPISTPTSDFDPPTATEVP